MLDKTKMSNPYEDQVPKNEEDFLFMLDMFGADWTGPCIAFSPSQRDETLQVLSCPRFRVLD